MRLATLTALFGALAATVAASQFTLEARSVDPTGWAKGARVSASRVLPFKVALKQQNLEKFDKMFWSISTPGMCVLPLVLSCLHYALGGFCLEKRAYPARGCHTLVS